MDHELVFLMKGFIFKSESRKKIEDILKDLPHKTVSFLDWGFDIRPYMWTMRNLNYDYFMFLNSYSDILYPNWLKMLYENITKPGIGIVGGSGACMTAKLEWERKFREAKGLRKLFYWPFLQAAQIYQSDYPNYHIRTNGFMISKAVANKLFFFPFIFIKSQAYLFESGRNGLTAQIRNLGLESLVVDKTGKGIPKEGWRDSNTLFWKDQSNLMIADNQTRMFENKSEEDKKKHELLFWHSTSR